MFRPNVFSRRTCLAALTVLGLFSPIRAQTLDRDPLIDTAADGKGRINYAAGTIKATGYGAPPPSAQSPVQARLLAMRAAVVDAQRNLAATVSSIQVTASTKVRNYIVQSDEVDTRLSVVLDQARTVSETFERDGTAVAVVEIPMYGPTSVASVVLPRVLSAAPAAAASYSAVAPSSARVFAGPSSPAYRIEPMRPAPPPLALLGGEPPLTPLSDSGPFTAVLVDCRGLGIQAVMSPKLLDTTGREVYGTVRVTPEYAIETGIVGYPRSMAEAIRGARAGSHPLIVRALRAADKHRFHPVISIEDADRILAANNRDRFLERTAVIFLVDPVK